MYQDTGYSFSLSRALNKLLLLPLILPPPATKEHHGQTHHAQENARDDKESLRNPHVIRLEALLARPCRPARAARLRRPRVLLAVEMRHLVLVAEGILPRAHAAPLAGAATPRVRSAGSAARALVMGSLALGPVRAPAPGAEEAGRRAREGAAPLAQAAGGSAPRGAGAVVRAFPRVGGVRGVPVQDVSVVPGALVGVGEHAVGLADAHEAVRRGGVVWVVVRVVRLGERVEGPGEKEEFVLVGRGNT